MKSETISWEKQNLGTVIPLSSRGVVVVGAAVLGGVGSRLVMIFSGFLISNIISMRAAWGIQDCST